MTDFQLDIITLMKCAFTGECAQLNKSFSLEEAEAFAAKQHITTLVYDGALRCGISPKEPAMQRMFQQYVKLMIHSERQLTEIEKICRAFEENGIDYLLLKGCNMKKMFPKHELRYMGDADILIRETQYDRIRSVMVQLQFTEGHEYYHECHWSNSSIHIELHKSLFPSKSRDFYAYWGNGWEKAQRVSGSKYVYSDEDNFLFLFSHFAKHYRSSGIGCRYLLDLWVLFRSHEEFDNTYLEQELSNLHLLEFYWNIRKLIAVWFEKEDTDDKVDFMTEFIFSGSSWGSWKNGQIAETVKNSKPSLQNKLGLILSKLFPPVPAMFFQYPALKKFPFLLPVYWVQRIVCALFISPEKGKKGFRMVKSISRKGIEQYKTHMQYVGLHFEEE